MKMKTSDFDFTLPEELLARAGASLVQENIKNNFLSVLIRNYLLFTDEELNTTQIIAAMKDIVPSSKCHKILKDKEYKKTHWCNFKKEGSKNEWVYKARQKFDNVQTVTYTEEDYKMELPSCLM